MAWRLNRLRCMSYREIGRRVGDEVQLRLERLGIGLAGTVSAPDFRANGVRFIARDPGANEVRDLLSAEAILEGHFAFFALTKGIAWDKVNWNRDPKAGVVSPMHFGKALQYRNSQIVGDIKYTWELNRHLHMVPLAKAFHLSGDERFLSAIAHHLRSWLEQCPYPLGPNWCSSLELGIRLINWSIVWQLAGGAESPMFFEANGKVFRDQWLESIYRHVHFIRRHLSRYSSANNHLIGEAAGMFVAMTTWPYWPEFSHWHTEAREILEAESAAQNFDDGVNREQAVGYQQFVFDLLLLAGLAGRSAGISFSRGYWRRLERMLEFVASIMDRSGNVPMIGDADDGYVTRLSEEPDWDPFRSMLATGAVLFQRADFAAKAGKIDDKTRWLLGREAESKFDKLLSGDQQSLPLRRAFPHGGYYVLGRDFDVPGEVRIVADAGPLGFREIAAHGHADALAFTLNLDGVELLIDPGTYAYHTKPEWRAYFRGTGAHNTVRIDGVDQSVSGGNFMWLRHARAECRVWKSDGNEDLWEGVHFGYQRLRDPVTHIRRMRFSKRERRLDISDTFDCQGGHRAELFFHFAPECEVRQSEDRTIVARRGRAALEVQVPKDSATVRLVRGSMKPICGWTSRRFDTKEPSTTLVVHLEFSGPTEVQSCIRCLLEDNPLPE